MKGFSYKDAGVDIEAGEHAVELMKAAVRATHDANVVTGLSDFGGAYALRGLRDPLLIAGTDGVGTKLKIAFALDKHDTVGQDLVAMCVDDIVCQGARPLFFLDYVATGKLEPEKVAEIVQGIAAGCKMAGCALLGGETAELPDFYAEGEYDLAGFAVGAVERDEVIDGSAVQAGDVVIALPSSGLHSNGYSLARKVLLEARGLQLEDRVDELGRTLGEELLEPTRIYCVSLVALFEAGIRPHGLAHITGGGIVGNLARAIPAGLCASVAVGDIAVPPIFQLIQRLGNVESDEMYRTFNMGAGMILVLDAGDVDSATAGLKKAGEEPLVVGEIIPDAEQKVILVDTVQ